MLVKTKHTGKQVGAGLMILGGLLTAICWIVWLFEYVMVKLTLLAPIALVLGLAFYLFPGGDIPPEEQGHANPLNAMFRHAPFWHIIIWVFGLGLGILAGFGMQMLMWPGDLADLYSNI